MRFKGLLVVLVVGLVVALVGCGKAEPTQGVEEAEVESLSPGAPGAFGGPDGGLQGVNRLALGTLKLEGTEDAVTPEQAAAMLPLWQAIQGGSLRGDAETDAVLKQIEGTLTDAQRAVIDDTELTFQDIGAWMEEQGIEMPARPGGGQGGPGAFQNMSEDERVKLREEFQNMTPEQRATRMAEMGMQRPGGGQGGPGGQVGRPGGAGRGGFLVEPLIELLTERAAQ
jgi:hypothetical protein